MWIINPAAEMEMQVERMGEGILSEIQQKLNTLRPLPQY